MSVGATYIFGCGGHGRVLLDVLRSVLRSTASAPDDVYFLDDRESSHGDVVDGVRIAGGSGVLGEGSRVLLGVGDNITRRNLYFRFKERGCTFPTLVAPSAVVSRTSRLDEGVVVLARAVVQTGAVIGPNAIINTAAVVEHDCRVEAHVQLAPMVALSGNVSVGQGTLIGTGASINKNVSIGEFCLISPGLPVIDDVPDHSVYKIDRTGVIVERNYRLRDLDPSSPERKLESDRRNQRLS